MRRASSKSLPSRWNEPAKPPVEPQAWVRRFARTGISPSDAEDILWLMWSVIRGLAIRNQIGRDPERSKRVTRMTIDLLSEYTGKLRKQPAHGEGPGEAG